MIFFVLVPLGLIFLLIEGLAAALLYLGGVFVFFAAIQAVFQAGYGHYILALFFGAIFVLAVVGWAIKAVQYFRPTFTVSGSVGALKRRAIALLPKRAALVVTSAVVIVIGLVVPPLAVGLLALAAADCFKARDYRNGVEAVFCALALFVLYH